MILAARITLPIAALFLATGAAHAEPSELKEWLTQCKKGDQHACQLVRSATLTEGQWVTYKDWELIMTPHSHVWSCFGVNPVVAARPW